MLGNQDQSFKARGQTLLHLLVQWHESPKVQVEVPTVSLMVALCPLLEADICNQLRTLNPKLLRWEGSFSRRFANDGSQIHLHSLISRLFNSGYGGNHTKSPWPHTAEWYPVSQVSSLTLHYNCLLWGPLLQSLKPDVSGWCDTWDEHVSF